MFLVYRQKLSLTMVNSYEFSQFCKSKSVKLTHSPPYHPQSNGIAERAVQTFKSTLKKCILDKSNSQSIEEKVSTCLYNYRNTKSTSTNNTPNEMIFSYKVKTQMDNINPRCFKSTHNSKITQSKSPSKSKHVQFQSQLVENPKSIKMKTFVENDKIFYRNHFKNDVKWMPAHYLKRVSEHTHLISVNGLVRLVHTNQFRESKLSDKYPTDIPVLNPLPVTQPEPIEEESKECATSTRRRTKAKEIEAEAVRRSARIQKQYGDAPPKYKY